MVVTIKAMEAKDWPGIERIYLDGIATGIATFETASPGWEKWNTSHLTHSRWIAEADQQVTGWMALSPVSDRCVYVGVAEISVYIDSRFRGQGVGHSLMTKVIESSEKNGIWTLNAAMFPENGQSIDLHLKCGFRRIGIREKIGILNEVWRDNGIMERRSHKF